MLVPQDEFAHDRGDAENWQENYVWHAWSPQDRCGWNMHLGNITSEGKIDVRAHVVINGEVTATSYQTPGSACLTATGLHVEVIEPFRRLRVQFEGVGAAGPDDGGWYGRGPGTVPFSIDVEIETRHAPFESNAHPELEGLVDLPGTGNHYELGGRWRGTLTSGGRSVESSGMVIRDHSWGGRVWGWDELFWMPMIFPDENLYLFSTTQRFGSEWKSLAVAMGEEGVLWTAPDVWVRVGGERRPRQFATAEVLALGEGIVEHATLRGDIHLPVGRARSRIGLSDMYGTVSWGGRTGFATVQIFPSEEDVKEGFTNPLPDYR